MIPPNPLTAIQQKIDDLLPQLATLESDFFAGDPIKPKLGAAVNAMRKMQSVIANPFAKQPEVPSEPARSGDLAKAGRRLCDLLEMTGYAATDNSPTSRAWREAIADMRDTLQRIERDATAPAAPTISPKNGVSKQAISMIHTARAGLC